MTATVTKISEAIEPTTTDPLRAELAAAIRERAAADAAIEAQRKAIARGKKLVSGAEARLESARNGIESGRAADAAAAAAALRTPNALSATGGRKTDATRTARWVEQNACDELETARAALALAQAELPELERQARFAANLAIVVRNRILVPLVEQLLDRGRSARQTLAICEQVLPALLQRDEGAPRFADSMDSLKAKELRAEPLKALYDEAHKFFAGYERDEDQAAGREAIKGLELALAALLRDADAAVEMPLLP